MAIKQVIKQTIQQPCTQRFLSSHLATAIGGICLVVLGACSPFVPPTRKPPYSTLATQYSLYTAETTQNIAWWQDLGWDDLDSLITKALAQNLSLQEAWARLEQAQANARMIGAKQLPTLNYTGSATHNRSATQLGNDGHVSTINNFSITLLSSYEVDLWGRVAANIHAAQLNSQASNNDLLTMRMTIAAKIVETGIRLIAQHGLIPLAKERWQRAIRQLSLLQLRYRQGLASGIDIAQQQRHIAEYRAALLPLEEQEQQLNYELALLLGKLPSWRWSVHRFSPNSILPPLPKIPAIGVPADLLAQRPDIRAAGLRLQAADWYVAAAKADRLPALRLTASGSVNDKHVAQLFDNWLANLAASVTGPLIDGGLKQAAVIKAQAVAAERLATYKKSVLTGIKEVETALMQEDKRAQELQAINTQLQQQQLVCQHKQQRYLNGEGSYLDLLGALQTKTLLQQQQLQMHRDLLLARTALHRALGGHAAI